MQTAAGSVENFFPSDEEALATVHAAIATAQRIATLLEELTVPAHVAVLAACWLLADLTLTAELHRGAPAALTRAMIDRRIGEAIGELRAAFLTDPAKVQ